MTSLRGKIALVTGASKGIGAGIAREFGARGAQVIVNYAKDRAGADAVVDVIRSNGGSALAYGGDVSREDDMDRLFRDVNASFGTVTIVVNNAAQLALGALDTLEEAQFRSVFGVNVWGPLLVTRKAVEQMGDAGGSIVNIGSTSSNVTIGPNKALYAGSKGALDVITRVLACELGPKGIRVNCLRSGLTETEGARAMGSLDPAKTSGVVARTPLGRLGLPQDIALAAAFLVSDEARWITGELINVSGGLY